MNTQSEKERLREVTDTYTKENAESEQEFKKLHHEIIQVKILIIYLLQMNIISQVSYDLFRYLRFLA